MTVLTPIDEAVQGLNHDPNALRLKKLLIYACKNTWESDPQRIACFNSKDLLQELVAIAPTPDQLQGYLLNLVETINKRDEYRRLAQDLMQRLHKVYVSTPVKFPTSSPTGLYLQVAQTLEQDPEYLRIKKLLFCACKNTWENNPSQLARYGLMDLIQELHNLTPSIETLDSTLRSIVKTLNRQEVYRPIAERISRAFQLLYHRSESQTQMMAPAFAEETGVMMPDEEQTGFAVPSPASRSAVPATTQINAPPMPTAEPTSMTGINLPGDNVPPPPAPPPLPPPIHPVTPPAASATPPPLPSHFQTRTLDDLVADLFDVRQEIMKYTNILRAKILLFSIVHAPPNVEHSIWQVVNNYDLDDLLRYLLQSHRVFSILEADLNAIARKLPESDYYRQAADTILRTIHPYYSGTIVELCLTSNAVASDPFAMGDEDSDIQSQPLNPGAFSLSFDASDQTGQLCDMSLPFAPNEPFPASSSKQATSSPGDETGFLNAKDMSGFLNVSGRNGANSHTNTDEDGDYTQARFP